jgi:hypothetical protein
MKKIFLIMLFASFLILSSCGKEHKKNSYKQWEKDHYTGSNYWTTPLYNGDHHHHEFKHARGNPYESLDTNREQKQTPESSSSNPLGENQVPGPKPPITDPNIHPLTHKLHQTDRQLSLSSK